MGALSVRPVYIDNADLNHPRGCYVKTNHNREVQFNDVVYVAGFVHKSMHLLCEGCDDRHNCTDQITCVNGKQYPTTCGPMNCDGPVGDCSDFTISLACPGYEVEDEPTCEVANKYFRVPESLEKRFGPAGCKFDRESQRIRFNKPYSYAPDGWETESEAFQHQVCSKACETSADCGIYTECIDKVCKVPSTINRVHQPQPQPSEADGVSSASLSSIVIIV